MEISRSSSIRAEGSANLTVLANEASPMRPGFSPCVKWSSFSEKSRVIETEH